MKLRFRRRPRVSFEEKVEQFGETPQLHTGTYYYVIAEDEGKRHILGPYNSHSEAEDAGTSNLDCFFEVRASNTRDKAEFIRRWKYNKLEESKDLKDSTRRVKHTA